jgi:hypothetical protein
MSTTDWKPSAPLAAATIAALAALARQWPKAMALALDPTDAGRAYMADFAYAMKGADLRAIPLAAREYVAEGSMPPKPADLGRLAREISAQHFPPTFRDPQRIDQAPAQPVTHLQNPDRIDLLGHRAHKQLGSWKLVAEVWALLWDTAPHDDNRAAVRRGDVPSDVFDDAIAAVGRGVRAKSYAPLSDAVGFA